MEKQQFISEAMLYMSEKAESNNFNCNYYEKGFTSEDQKDLNLITETNIKYFKMESNVLMGDFFVFESQNETNPSICRFEAQYLYDSFLKGGWDIIGKIVESNIHSVMEMESSGIMRLIETGQYDALKDRLIVRPLNHSDHRYEFKDCICRKVGDIMLVLYLVVLDQRINEQHNYSSVKVQKSMISGWGISEDELWQTAMINTNSLYPPRIYLKPMDAYNPPYSRGTFMAWKNDISRLNPTDSPTLTTTSQMNGAIALFYPGVMKRISEMFDGDFYAVFTSIHELHLHKKGYASPLELLRRLKSMNAAFSADEILSRKIYLYERNTDELKQLEL